MAIKLKQEDWKAGYRKPIQVQQTQDGWFAQLNDEENKTSAFSGPWPTQGQAEESLRDGILFLNMTYG